jgi:H+/Cl- antiporter ClcA
MSFIADLNQWLLAEWIWSMTWGLYHIPITIISMLVMMRIYLKLSIKSAMVLALGSSLFAVMVYTVYVSGFLIYFLGLTTDWVAEPLPAALYLGIIYGFLQSVFFWFLMLWRPINLRSYIFVVVLSNIVAALIVYKLTLIGLSL